MKEIILPTELMAFFILNMFGHDSALHDFTTSSPIGKSRVLSVLRNNSPSTPGTGSFSGGGGIDIALDNSTVNVYNNTIGQTLYSCLKSTGFFDIKRFDKLKSDAFIIVDPKLAMGVAFSGQQIINMGIAPGFIYLPGRTYSPFEFTVINRFDQDMIQYEHHVEKWIIQINYVGGLDPYQCFITKDRVTTSYNLLSSAKNVPWAFEMISINPDVSNAFMLNTVSTSVTNYVDYIQLLLDGEASRYTFILSDYNEFKCTSAAEKEKVNELITRGKQFLLNTITEFWSYFYSISGDLNNMLVNMHSILVMINQIQEMFALIYKAILCAVGTAVKARLYSCNPPPIAEVSDINKFYLANKSKLEMFVYEYMVSIMKFDETQSNQLKNLCNYIIQNINAAKSGISDNGNITLFINFLQIVSNTLIDKETDKEEIQEQKENEVEYVKNYHKETYINQLTDLTIIKDNPLDFTLTTQYLPLLINIVQQTLGILFDGKMPQDPDYAIILTDAVGSENVLGVKNLLLSGHAGQFTADQAKTALEMLQTLFLDLINRLDTDQLQALGTHIKELGKDIPGFFPQGQSGGAKKKPTYLFVYNDAFNFFTQLTQQNRLTKIKSKIKELFDNIDIFPAFYTDLIIKPNLPNVLDWTIDFNDVFLGFIVVFMGVW